MRPIKHAPIAALTLCLLALLAGCQDKTEPVAGTPLPIIENNQLRYPAGHPQLKLLVTETAREARTFDVELPARLVWNEERTQRIYPAFAGRVSRIVADVGQRVGAGQVLAELASPEFGAAQADTSRAQADALEKTLNDNPDNEFKTFVSMRYWHPLPREIIKQIENYKPQHIVLLPLYPQFSTTTTRSSLNNFWANVQEDDGWLHAAWNDEVKVSTICCYPFNKGFIESSAANLKKIYDQAKRDGHKAPRVLFSAHGLPKSVITDGDPYEWQCEQTAEKIVHALGIPDLDWKICYQSRVGKQEWLGPSTEQELTLAGKTNTPVIIYPHAFTQEHVETLVEIEIEYREFAHEAGVPGFYRVPTVSLSPGFIDGLAQMVKDRVKIPGVHADGLVRICPSQFKRCCMEKS